MNYQLKLKSIFCDGCDIIGLDKRLINQPEAKEIKEEYEDI